MNRFDDIRKWAIARNLIDGSDPKSQMLKTVEELGELSSAIAKNKRSEIVDGIGDVVVTLVIIAYQYGMTIEDCIEYAWDEIKDRKGQMVNGVFVKEL
jgi:NTP pyrophosphatase (non-canonical NTP hydrolase)